MTICQQKLSPDWHWLQTKNKSLICLVFYPREPAVYSLRSAQVVLAGEFASVCRSLGSPTSSWPEWTCTSPPSRRRTRPRRCSRSPPVWSGPPDSPPHWGSSPRRCRCCWRSLVENARYYRMTDRQGLAGISRNDSRHIVVIMHTVIRYNGSGPAPESNHWVLLKLVRVL